MVTMGTTIAVYIVEMNKLRTLHKYIIIGSFGSNKRDESYTTAS